MTNKYSVNGIYSITPIKRSIIMGKTNTFIAFMLMMVMFGFIGMSCTGLAGVAITEATQSQQNKRVNSAVAHAISEIERVLPANAIVWINKGRESASHQVSSLGVVTSTGGAVDTAVDDITAAFIQKGIRLVDRQNAALIQAEQKFQYGGNVSDQDLISIGNAAGANTLVTVSVVPQGNRQRLQIRVLDIEKGVPLMQSDSSNEWRL
jgi:hypothetical protein